MLDNVDLVTHHDECHHLGDVHPRTHHSYRGLSSWESGARAFGSVTRSLRQGCRTMQVCVQFVHVVGSVGANASRFSSKHARHGSVPTSLIRQNVANTCNILQKCGECTPAARYQGVYLPSALCENLILCAPCAELK